MTSLPKELAPLPDQSGRDPELRYGDLAASMTSKLSFTELPEDHRFHILMMGELAAAELSAANVYETESMPWELTVDMARQCWDEARHAEINRRFFVGGGNGQSDNPLSKYDAVNIYYDVYYGLSLAGRLAILCIVDEARALDNQYVRAHDLATAGELQKARSTERIMHEEVRHVGYGNRWLNHLANKHSVSKDELIALGRQELANRIETMCGSFPAPGAARARKANPVPIVTALQARAGFTPEELREAARMQQRELGDGSPYVGPRK